MSEPARVSWLVLLGACVAAACARASEEDLLQGKPCSRDADCILGFACDPGAGVCARNVSASAGATGNGAGSGGGGNTGGEAAQGGNSSQGGDGAGAAGFASPDGGLATNACDLCSDNAVCIESKCVAGWTSIRAAPAELVARTKAAYAVGNDKVLIWGGVNQAGVDLASGAIYDATHDTWEVVPASANTPSPRMLANAVWTGSLFLVWGGRLNSGQTDYRNGALYDPSTRVWTPISLAGSARSASLLSSYDDSVVSWGGWSKNGSVLENSQRYAVAADDWTPTVNDLLGRREHVAWATRGARLYIIGGRSNNGVLLGDTFVYDMSTSSWSPLQSLPGARYGAFAAHDGEGVWIWGGRTLDQALGDGLSMAGALWASTSDEGEPSARWAPHRQSGWTCPLVDGRVAIVGGHDASGIPQLDGGVYDRIAREWAPIPPSSEAHDWGVGVCVTGKVLLWGGSTDGTSSVTGELWAP